MHLSDLFSNLFFLKNHHMSNFVSRIWGKIFIVGTIYELPKAMEASLS